MLKRFVASALVVGGVLGGLAATPAEALPTQMSIRTYYSTSAKTVEVGEKLIISCDGNGQRMLWGVTSAYYNTTFEPCSGY
ncbi:MAG: DUF6289 family protein [Myxococcota bacterium]